MSMVSGKNPVLLLLAVFAPCVMQAESILIDGIAAHVNQHTITIGDVLVVVQPAGRQLRKMYKGDELKARLRKTYRKALDSLIERRLILDSYEQQEMRIPDWVIDKRTDEIIHDMFRGDRSALMTLLAGDRLTFEDWRKDVQDHIIVSSMRSLNVQRNTRVSLRATRSAYDNNLEKYRMPGKVKLRMIVLKKDAPGGKPELKQRQAEDIRKKLTAGEDFAVLAKNLSDGSRAAKGGDWGWIDPKETLRPELAKAALELKSGEISEVIETGDEIYILKVEGRRNESVAPFEDVQPRIERKLRQKDAERLYKAWVDRLKEDAFVRVFDVNPF